MILKFLVKTKVSLVAVIIIIFIVAAGVAVFLLQTETVYEAVYPVYAKNNKSLTNFSETGNLVKNNPGMEKNVWYLSYEKPGQPILSVKLNFIDKSLCNLSGKEEVCQSTKLAVGKLVNVSGNLKDNEVEVDKLISVNEANTAL